MKTWRSVAAARPAALEEGPKGACVSTFSPLPLLLSPVCPWFCCLFPDLLGLTFMFPSSSRCFPLGPLEGALPPGLRQAGPPLSHTGPDRTPCRAPPPRAHSPLSPPQLLCVSARTGANWPRASCLCEPGLGSCRCQAPRACPPPLTPPRPPFLGAVGEAWRTRRCWGPRVSPPAAVRTCWRPGSQDSQQVGRPHVSLAGAFFPFPAGTFSGERSLRTARALGVGPPSSLCGSGRAPLHGRCPASAVRPPGPARPPGLHAPAPLPVPPPLPQLA